MALFQELLNIVEIRRSLSPTALSHFLGACLEQPCPAPGGTITVVTTALSGKDGELDEHVLQRPEVNEILLDYVTFFPLFSCVSVKNIVHLFSNALLERRIIMVAENLATLSSCVMAASSLLQPFHWQHVYIPVLPLVLMDYCLATDQQILTQEGFLSVDDFAQRHADGSRAPLLVAAVDARTGQLVYEAPSRLIVNDARSQPMVEVEHDGVSALVTPEHDMFVRRGGAYAKVQAGLLLRHSHSVRMMTCASAGVASSCPAAALPWSGCRALLELYGMWWRAGCMTRDACNALVWSPAMGAAVSARLKMLGLLQWSSISGGSGGCVECRSVALVRAFALSAPGSGSLADWVWALSATQARQLLVSAGDGRAVLVPTVAAREQWVRLALHAGFSPIFCGTPDGRWCVRVDGPTEALLHGHHVRARSGYHDRTWCVTVPHGLIVTRRVLARDASGLVSAASAPLVVGNCTAPMPFFVGVLKSCLPLLETMPLEEVLVLDVENDRFLMDPGFEDTLPKPEKKRLVKTLKAINLTPERESDLQIASSFYQFFFDLFAGYEGYYELQELPPARGDPPDAPRRQGNRFDKTRFLGTKPAHVRDFLEQFDQAQILQTFLQENENPERRYKFVNQAEYTQHLRVASNTEMAEMAEAMRSMGRALGTAWQELKEAAAKKRAQKKAEENQQKVLFGTLKKNPHSSPDPQPVRVPASENIDLILAKEHRKGGGGEMSSPGLSRRAPTHRPCTSCHIYMDVVFTTCPHCGKPQPSASPGGASASASVIESPPSPTPLDRRPAEPSTPPPLVPLAALDEKYRRPPPPPPKGVSPKRPSGSTIRRTPPPPPVPKGERTSSAAVPRKTTGDELVPLEARRPTQLGRGTSTSMPDVSTLHIHYGDDAEADTMDNDDTPELGIDPGELEHSGDNGGDGDGDGDGSLRPVPTNARLSPRRVQSGGVRASLGMFTDSDSERSSRASVRPVPLKSLPRTGPRSSSTEGVRMDDPAPPPVYPAPHPLGKSAESVRVSGSGSRISGPGSRISGSRASASSNALPIVKRWESRASGEGTAPTGAAPPKPAVKTHARSKSASKPIVVPSPEPIKAEVVRAEVLVAPSSPRRPAPPPPKASLTAQVVPAPTKVLVKVKVPKGQRSASDTNVLPACVYCGERAERPDARFCIACGKEMGGVAGRSSSRAPPAVPPAMVRAHTASTPLSRGSGRTKPCDSCGAENETIAPQCTSCKHWF